MVNVTGPGSHGNQGTNSADVLAGTSFDDYITALGGDDVILGSLGADFIDGGDGIDVVDYSASTSGVTVDLFNSYGLGGLADGDTYLNVENVVGSVFNNSLFGDNGANRLDGGKGDDHLFGQDGNDQLYGGDGVDQLYGGRGDDYLDGGAGANYLSGGDGKDTIVGGADNDRVNGGSGADILDGGGGVNTLEYDGSNAGVLINLLTHAASGGDATGDVFKNFQNVSGSAFNDVLIGDNGANVLNGGAGDDHLDGGKGADTLDGGAGNDVLIGGEGDDVFNFHVGAYYTTDGPPLTPGKDTVLDFKLGADQLHFFGALTDLQLTQSSAGAVITFAQGSVTLDNVSAAQLVHTPGAIVFN